DRHRAGARAVGGGDAQYPAEPVLRLRLQRRRCTDRRGRALSGVRPLAVAGDRGGGDGPVFCQRGWQRAETPPRAALKDLFMRVIPLALLAVLIALPAPAAEWTAQVVKAPARVNAVEIVGNAAEIEAGGLWYRLGLGPKGPTLTFLDNGPD